MVYIQLCLLFHVIWLPLCQIGNAIVSLPPGRGFIPSPVNFLMKIYQTFSTAELSLEIDAHNSLTLYNSLIKSNPELHELSKTKFKKNIRVLI